MATVATSLGSRRFGETARRDAWWVQPLAVFAGFSAFIVYATWAAFQGEHYTYGPYLSPFYSPELFGDSPHAWFGPKPGWWPAWLPLFAGALDPLGSRPASASPATTTAAPTTRRSGPIRPPAPSASRARATAASSVVPAHPAERPPLLPVPGARVPRHPVLRRLEGAVVRRPGHGPGAVRHRRRHARSWRSTSSCSAATRSAATRCAISSAAGSTCSRRRPVRERRYNCVSCLNRRHMLWAWTSLFLVGIHRLLRPAVLDGHLVTDWRIF